MRLWAFVITMALGAEPHRLVTHARAPFGIIGVAPVAGFVYVAGTDGPHRFDGFRYAPIPGYPFTAADAMDVGSDGVIWILSKKDGLTSYHPERGFRVVSRASSLRGAASGKYFLLMETGRLVRVDAAGGTKSTPLRLNDCYISTGTITWVGCPGAGYRLDLETMGLSPFPNPVRASNVAWGRSGMVWSTVFGRVHRGAATLDLPGVKAWGVWEGLRGQVWLAHRDGVRGLESHADIPFDLSTQPVLKTDSRGHVWIGARDGSLRELVPEPKWEHWPVSAFGGSTPMQFFQHDQHGLIGVTEGGLYRLDEKAREWRLVPKTERKFAHVLPLTGGTWIGATRGDGLVQSSGARIEGSADAVVRRDFRELARTADGRLLAGNKKGLFEIKDGRIRFLPLPGFDQPPKPGLAEAHAVAFGTAPDGKLWLGYSRGLLRDDEGWRSVAVDPPVTNIRSFCFRGDEIWVAHRAKGYFSRIRQGKSERLTVEQGYGPEQTFFLRADRRGWIWRASSDGVYVNRGDARQAEDWLKLETGELMQHGFFEHADGSIWLAGLNGVFHVRSPREWFGDQPGVPLLSSTAVNGRKLRDLPSEFGDPISDLSFELSGLRGTGPRREPFRYRLSPRFADWRVAPAGRIELRDLGRGEYRLEVRELGFSGMLVKEWRVGLHWRWWPWLAGSLAATAALWGRRERSLYRMRKAWFLLRRRLRPVEAPSAASLRTGNVLKDRYEVQELLSRGGFAHLYAAIDRETGQRVAMKVLRQRSGESAWLRVRFAQEVAALRSVQHKRVVPLLDSWITAHGEAILVMPLFARGSLRGAMGARWARPRVARFVEGLAQGVVALHAAGIIHRDLKPENILLDHEDNPVLIDLGTSGLLGQHETPGHTKLLAGSLDYLAPERLTGFYSQASDTYALGVIAFELICGTPFAAAGIALHDSGMAAALAAHSGSHAIGAVLAEALHLLPEKRPVDIQGWAGRLAAACLGPERH